MKLKQIFFLITLSFVFLTACKIFKTNQDKDEVILTAKVDDFMNYRENDPVKVVNGFIQDTILNLDVTYSGGCKAHTFELIGSKFIQKSLPPQRGVLLVHHANNDDCRELMGERLKFNIKPLVENYSKIELILGESKTKYVYESN